MIRAILRRIRDRLLLSDSQYIHRTFPQLGLTTISDTSENDVFVAGYPKSGNTWMQHLLSGLQYGIETQYLPDRLAQILVPDVHQHRYFRRISDVTFFKTHDLPKPQYRRVIHLVRDGRDVMASYYAYNKNLGQSVDLEKMIVEGEGLYLSTWQEHARQWLENPFGAEILQVRYEDLLDDTHLELQRICEFVGLERDKELISRVVEGCTFNEMQRKENTYGWSNPEWPRDKPFVRKGRAGAYLDDIPLELVGRFESEAAAYLQRFGYELG